MRTDKELKAAADFAAERLKKGEIIECSGDTLDALIEYHDELTSETCSAHNKNALGLGSQYVAWLYGNSPADIEFHDGFAYATAKTKCTHNETVESDIPGCKRQCAKCHYIYCA